MIRLTSSSTPNAVGALYYNERLHVQGFEVNFQFNISDYAVGLGHDGIVFIVHNGPLGNAAFNQPGGGLGYAPADGSSNGLENSVVLEMDTFQNTALSDYASQHASIHSMGHGRNSAMEQGSDATKWCSAATNMYSMLTAAGFQGTIRYVPPYKWQDGTHGRFQFWDSRQAGPIIDCAMTLADVVALEGDTAAFMGFLAATDNVGDTHDLLAWDYTFLGVLNASTTYALGDGISHVVAGHLGEFSVVARDQFGYVYPTPSAEFSAKMTRTDDPSTEVQVTLVQVEGGEYTGSYNTTVAASYTLDIRLEDDHIQSSPFDVTISPGPVSGPHCLLTNEHNIAGGVAGHYMSFTVLARDQFGNRITEGGSTVELTVTGCSGTGCTEEHVDDVGDGSYNCSIDFKTRGAYSLGITIDSMAVAAPIPFSIAAAAVSPPDCVPEGADYAGGLAGTLLSFRVLAFDDYENQLTVGGAHLHVVFAGAGTVTTQWSDNNDGSYSVNYTTPTAATYNLEVNISKADEGIPPAFIKNSPSSVLIDPSSAAVASECDAYGAALEHNVAGGNTFVIQARDAFRNNLTANTAEFLSSARSGDGPITAVAVVYDGAWGGLYRATYNITMRGAYDLEVKLRAPLSEDPLPGSPFALTVVPDVPVASTSFAHGDALTRAVAGTSSFHVQARDKWGNNLISDVASIEVDITQGGSTWHGVPSYVDDGRYAVEYFLNTAGNYSTAILLGGTALPLSPFGLQVVPGAAQGNSSVVWGSGISRIVAGSGNFSIQARDIYGNNLTENSAVFDISIVGAGTVDAPIIKYVVEGRYTVQFEAKVSGAYNVAVTIDGQHAPGSPYALSVVPGTFSILECDAVGDANSLSVALTDAVRTFTVFVRDRNRNPVEQAYNVSFTLAPAASTHVPADSYTWSISRGEGGQYQGKYTVTERGEYVIDLLVEGLQLPGAPYNISVQWQGTVGVVLGVLGGVVVVAGGTFLVIFYRIRSRRLQYLSLQ